MLECLSKLPRLTLWIVTAILLMAVLGLIEPQQLSVLAYKLLLVSAAAVAGYWLDRSLFYYARPHELYSRAGYAEDIAAEDVVCRTYLLAASAATLRRAIVILAVVIGVALGL